MWELSSHISAAYARHIPNASLRLGERIKVGIIPVLSGVGPRRLAIRRKHS